MSPARRLYKRAASRAKLTGETIDEARAAIEAGAPWPKGDRQIFEEYGAAVLGVEYRPPPEQSR